MNDLQSCGRLRLFRLGLPLSHLRVLYKTNAAPMRILASRLTTTTTTAKVISGYRHFSNCQLRMADMNKWTATVVRKTFLEYFEKNGHTIGT